MISTKNCARNIEMRAADNTAAGMSPQQARYEAQKRFGNTTLLKEDTRGVDIISWLDETARDFRLALRLLQRSPGFTHCRHPHSGSRHRRHTAIFSVIDSVFFALFRIMNRTNW